MAPTLLTQRCAALALLVAVAACRQPDVPPVQRKGMPMSTSEENKQVVTRVFEEAINTGNLDLLNELLANDYVGSNSGLSTVGPAAFANPIRALREAFPDIHYELLETVAAGDRVAVRWRWTGTHRGTYRGPGGTYAPTGNHVANDGMAVFEVRSGRLQRASLLTDRLGFLQDVGAIPKPAPPGR